MEDLYQKLKRMQKSNKTFRKTKPHNYHQCQDKDTCVWHKGMSK